MIRDLVTVLAVIAWLVVYATPASAASGGGSQCRNGGNSPLTPIPCLNGTLGGVGFSAWSGGAANSGNSHWSEGDFISYRATLSGVTPGDYTLRLSYITVSSSRHALDYLGSFDATETTSPTPTPVHANNNNPCVDTLGSAPGSGCTPAGTPPVPASTFPVPLANLSAQRTCGGASGLPTVPTQVPGVFSLFAPSAAAATMTGASYVSQNVVSGGGTCSTTIDVSFRVSGTTSSLVLAWGGRIASVLDWGDGNSASAISGSPYHMSIVSLNGSPSVSAELALSAAAIAAPPTVVTQISATGILSGNNVTDSVHLTGSRGTVTGTVQFQLCANTTSGCPQSTGADIGSPVTLVNGSATSIPFGADLAPGDYCVGVEYVGDENSLYSGFYSGDPLNECFSVIRAAPSISTQLSTDPIVQGDAVHDTAALHNATATAGGTVEYRFYPSVTACDADTAAFPTTPTGGTTAGTVTVTNGVVPNSNTINFPNAGTFYWAAFYSGDVNNTPVASECATEALLVEAVSPEITTVLPTNPISAEGSAHDTAELHGVTATAGGTVEFRFYPSQATCDADTAAFPTAPTGGTSAGTVTVTNGVVPNSNTITFPNAGTFYWAAFYSGEGVNAPAASDCVTEALVVEPLTPTITTLLSAHTIGVGGSVHDTAALHGGTATVGGTVEYRFYASLATCVHDTGELLRILPPGPPTGGTPAGTVTVTNGAVPNSNTVTFSNTGTFHWAAFYSGDPNNAPAASECRTEPLVVQATPTVVTQLDQATIPPGGSVTDAARLEGATPTAGGQVQYRFYPSLEECEVDTAAWPATAPTWPTGGTFAGLATVTDGSLVPSDVTVTFPDPGTFFWAAFYTGDADNALAASACDTERLDVLESVQPNGLIQDKTVDRQVASVGDRLTYTITIANIAAGGASDISAHDLLPTGVAFVSADTHGLGTFDPATGIWTIPLLPGATTATLTLVVTVLPEAAGQTLTNAVTVTTPEGPPAVVDPCPGDPGESCASTVVLLPATGVSPSVVALFELSGVASALGLILTGASRFRRREQR